MKKIIFRGRSQKDIDIRHAEIGINDEHLFSFRKERECEIHGQIRFADAALAARDGDDSRTLLRHRTRRA